MPTDPSKPLPQMLKLILTALVSSRINDDVNKL